jgi:hypothetical protein
MTVFLLSPAYCGGRRAAIALKPGSELPLARKLADGQLDLGSAFAFFSGLYFRGKLAYARRFGTALGLGIEPVMIITPTRGLMSPAELVNPGVIREFASVDVSEGDARYRAPLERDVATLALRLPGRARVVLLGSVASGKYADVLRPMLGDRLCYPTSFIGRGDMSRGGLLLRCVDSGEELDYEVLTAGMRPRGSRPPKLDPATRPQFKV